MSSAEPQWTLEQLQEHLQAAVDLEFWTIPYYMAAAYSIKDQGEAAFQLILSVVNQEMLHVQLAANIANAYGLKPLFKCPVYEGTHIPHLDFSLDDPDPGRCSRRRGRRSGSSTSRGSRASAWSNIRSGIPAIRWTRTPTSPFTA